MGRLPPVHGRGRRPRQAPGGLHHVGQGRPGRQDRHHARPRAPRELPQDVPLGPQRLLRGAVLARLPHAHRHPRRTWRRWPPATPPAPPAIVRDELPFPGILGRVCPRYCEPVCRRGDVDEPIAICALHRAAADHSGTLLVPGVPTGRRVAVIGAGPAGLAAAWFLTQGGHEVTIYDANEEPGGSLRYSIPEFRLPGKVVEKELEPALGGRRALHRRVRAGLRGRPRRALRRRLRRGDHQRRQLGGVESRHPRRRRRPERPRAAQARARGPGRQVHPEGRRDRRRRHRVRRRPHGAPQGRQGRRRRRPARGRRHPGRRARPRRRPRGGRQGRVRRPDQEGQDQGRQGAGRRVRPRRAREGPPQGGPRLALRARRDDRRHGDRLRAQARRQRRLPAAGRLAAASPTTTPGARPKRACSPPATPSPAPGPSSTRWPAASARRSPSTPGCAARTSRSSRSSWPCFNGLPYLDQLKDEAQLGELGERLAERSPVWLKMGASAESAARATMPKVGKQKRLTATDLEVEKGYSLAAARAEATRCLQCECPSNGACDLQKLGVEYDITDNDLVVKGNLVREVEPQYEHPFIRRDMEPLHRLRQVRARVPGRRRPGLLRLHGPRLHDQRRHARTATPCSSPTASPAAAASPTAPPARSPSTSASWPRSRSTRAAASCATSAWTCARSTRSRTPTTSRTPATSGASSWPRAASWPAVTACAPAAAPRSSCARS